MTAEHLLLLLFALGTGVSVGWILHAKHIKLNPEGVARVAASLGTEVALSREEARKTVEKYERLFEQERQQWRAVTADLQTQLAHAIDVGRAPPAKPAAARPPPSTPPPATNGTTDVDRMRHGLERAGLSPARATEMAEQLVAGNEDALEQDPILAPVIDEIRREQTGTT